MKYGLLFIAFLFLLITIAHAQIGPGLGPQGLQNWVLPLPIPLGLGGSSNGSGVPPPVGAIVQTDGTSLILQTDDTSSICLAGATC